MKKLFPPFIVLRKYMLIVINCTEKQARQSLIVEDIVEHSL